MPAHYSALIPAFPADVGREAFANWLSGFVDGEGHFGLILRASGVRRIPTARFMIRLRADDRPVLELIQSFFQCGHIRLDFKHGGSKPVVVYNVSVISDLASIIAPHFTRYPLRAKKSQDFAIWKAALPLIQEVTSQRRVGIGLGKGTKPLWTEANLNRLRPYCEAIKAQRIYDPSLIHPPSQTKIT